MRRTALLAAAALGLTACGSGPVTSQEAAEFVEVARDEVRGAESYTDELITAMAERVCRVLGTDGTTADDALAAMDNYKSLSPEEQATIVELAAGSACPEHAGKVATL